MIQLAGASKAFGKQVLLRDAAFRVGEGDRVGLVGPNGSGKTTLLRILAGQIELDSGDLTRAKDHRCGYLPQDGLRHEGRSLFEEAKSAYADLLELRREQERIGEELEIRPTEAGLLSRFGEIEDEWQRRGGYEIGARVGEVLSGLGFSKADHERPTGSFSQGWQMRIALARLLIEGNDLILLDEPTNYLDIEARSWLLGFLSRHRGGLVLVAHDRYFLDSVVTRITEIGMGGLRDYPGNFSRYETRRAAEIADLRKRAAEQNEEIERHKRFISRFRYQASRARQVQSRVKALDRMERIDLPPEPRRFRLRLPPPPRSGPVPVRLTAAAKAYGETVVFRPTDLAVERGQRLALVGPNGAGKSTLMRLLAGEEKPDSGARELGHNTRIAYYGPDRHDLDPERTVRETMSDAASLEMLPRIRDILGAFLFSGDAVDKRAAVLSGGERSRLALARLMLRPANLLLLDEPTNHLDLDSKAALLDALKAYGGTIVFVAHDRHFMDALATRVAVIGDGGARLYWGNYSDTLARESAVEETPSRSPDPPRKEAPRAPGSMSKNRLRRLKRSWKEAFDRVAATEAAIEELEARMSRPGFFDDREISRQITREYDELKAALPALFERLEGLDNQLGKED